jgi:hypothetical protein
MKNQTKAAATTTQIETDIQEVIRLHDCITKTEAKALGMRIDAGNILLKQKAEKDEAGKKVIGRGEWVKWLKNTYTEIDVRTLQRYMELAKQNDRLSLRKTCKTTNEAYEVIKASKPKKQTVAKVKFDNTMAQEVLGRVSGEIRESKVSLNLSDWNIKGGELLTNDNDNRTSFGLMITKLGALLENQQYSSVESGEERREKLSVIIRSLFATIISHNKPEPAVNRLSDDRSTTTTTGKTSPEKTVTE